MITLRCMRLAIVKLADYMVRSIRDKLPVCFQLFKTDKYKRYLFSFGGKMLTDKKSPPLFFRSIINPTHHFLCFCLFFLAVPTDWVGKYCGRKLGGQLGKFIAKSPL
jgi:hypothetical protein